MDKCFFSSQNCKITPLEDRNACSVSFGESVNYWISGMAEEVSKGLSAEQKVTCFSEIEKLNKDGFIPFWVQHKYDENETGKEVSKKLKLLTFKEVLSRS